MVFFFFFGNIPQSVQWFLRGGLVTAGVLLVDFVGDASVFFSAVRTEERAATAAALCDPWPVLEGFGDELLLAGDELNADDKAANAEARCVGPWFPLDLSWAWNNGTNQKLT